MAVWFILTATLAWQPTPALAGPAPAATSADVLVACPVEYREALLPWLEYRAAEGHRIAFAANESSGEALRDEIRARGRDGSLNTVLLVGDVPTLVPPPEIGLPELAPADSRPAPPGIPTFTIPAKINVRFGSTPEIATDLPYADVDDDGLPDLAVGRWPVDSAEEVATYVRRTLAYERNLAPTTIDDAAWQREIDVVCGVGGFGWLADKLLEDVTKKLIVEEIPPEYDVRVTYANWRSPYCPDPRAFGETVVSQLERGPLFWVYVGHGHRRTLDRMRVEGDTFPILDETHCDFRGEGPGRTIAVLLACFAGAFDHPQDCLVESMLRDEEGPVAVVASTRVAMPYAMSVLARGMMQERFAGNSETLGDLFLVAKRRMSETPAEPDATRKLMDTFARALSPHKDELQAELDEHQALFHLFGDPLLRLPKQGSFDLAAPENAAPGERIVVAPEAGALAGGPGDSVRVELISRRDDLRHEVAYRGGASPYENDWSQWTSLHALANDKRWIASEAPLDPTAQRVAFDVPEGASGECFLRCTISKGGKIVCTAKAIRIEELESAPEVAP